MTTVLDRKRIISFNARNSKECKNHYQNSYVIYNKKEHEFINLP
jgi:hypothetical protein